MFFVYVCSFRVFVVKLKPQQNIQQLPSPEQNPVFSYQYVHKDVDGGTYIADVFDKYVLYHLNKKFFKYPE